MPISKKRLMNTMVVGTLAMVGFVVVVPWTYKMMLVLAIPLMWLMTGGIYYYQLKQAIEKCKVFEQHEHYQEELQLLKQMEAKGYLNFTLDSYRIYALYFLGNFYEYECAALRMSKDRAWKRPIHQNLKDKVVDNMCCIYFLRHYQATGEYQYAGRNIVILDALEAASMKRKDLIMKSLEDYPDLPLLKKAVLEVLLEDYDQAASLYPEGSEAQRLLLSMKGERKKHGKSSKK